MTGTENGHAAGAPPEPPVAPDAADFDLTDDDLKRSIWRDRALSDEVSAVFVVTVALSLYGWLSWWGLFWALLALPALYGLRRLVRMVPEDDFERRRNAFRAAELEHEAAVRAYAEAMAAREEAKAAGRRRRKR